MANDNNEKKWLRWIVRIILPALIAAMWWGLSGNFDELRDEVKEFRLEMRTELKEQAETNQAQDIRLMRHEEKFSQILRTLYGEG